MSNKNAKLGGLTLFNIVLFGFMGQVAWAVENNFFNLFLFNKIGGTSRDISHMVAASAVVAVLTTIFMGTLSDKVNRRKIFICGGYLIWGFTVMVFAWISRENVAKLFGIDVAQVLPATVAVVIIMDCLMTFFGSTSNDAAFNAWITDITSTENRARTEGLLATLPVLAMVIVTVAFGAIVGGDPENGYSKGFIGLGVLVALCGLIGLFTIKDSRSGVKSESNFWADLIYGFRPSVIRNHKALYLSLLSMGIFSIASQVFFPYLFIYVQHQIGLDLGNLNLTPAAIVIAVLAVAGVIAGCIAIGSLMDKVGKSYFSFPATALFIIGLALVYFAKDLLWFAVFAVVAFAGYGLLMIMLNAAIRDFTPEDKVGQFQGVRMIFVVMLPMLIGPAIGSAVTEKFAVLTYTNDYNEIVNVPPPHIYVAAALTALPILLVLVFLFKEWKKAEKKA
ncbi:MAG: MFS transporter [Clostridia bacterium]|nr:MFS transporter [Clostridia bacterium]